MSVSRTTKKQPTNNTYEALKKPTAPKKTTASKKAAAPKKNTELAEQPNTGVIEAG